MFNNSTRRPDCIVAKAGDDISRRGMCRRVWDTPKFGRQ